MTVGIPLSPGRVLVTGGASFLGEHLAPALVRFGATVRVLDRVPRPAWIGDRQVEYVQADVREEATVARALAGVDTVVHAAFASPREPGAVIREVNETATARLLTLARAAGVRRFILVSSTIVLMPPCGHPLLARTPVGRLDLYRQTRVAAERLAEGCAGPGFVVAVARPATFLGPGRVAAFAFLFDWIRRGGIVPVLGPGHSRYQILDVRDLADGLCRLAADEQGGRFAFGARDVSSMRAELEALIVHAGTGARVWCVPAWPARLLPRGLELVGLAPLSEWHRRAARQEDWVLDVSPAERRLGWRATRSNLQALIEAYDWYVDSVAAGAAPRGHPIPLSHHVLRRLAAWLGPGR